MGGKGLFFAVITVGFLVGGLLLLWVAQLDIPDLTSFNNRLVSESTKIYDRTGEILLYDVHDTVQRRVVPFDAIASSIKNATVAIEDSEFYEHWGIKPLATFRAIFIQPLRGKGVQGGSTITQQLIKNSVLTQDRTITRKIKEWVLAWKVERVMTKEEILELYLNETPYGGNIYGIEEAARVFFSKPAKDLTITEAAYLAAIPQAPTFYSPYGNHQLELEARKNLVLQRMAELKFITEEQKEQSVAEKITFSPQATTKIKAPHFVMYVRSYLEEKYGAEAVRTKGFKVITSLDWGLQEKAEQIVNKFSTENITKFNARNAGMVVIDPTNGQILAMVGSRDYFDTENEGNFNVTLAHRQPGSAFKPFVYAAAFNVGYTDKTVVFDLPTQFDTNCQTDPTRCYTPTNYDDKFRGPISLRDALAQSVNIPALKMLYLVGLNQALGVAKAAGITSLTDPSRYGLTLVLGGGEVSLLELTGAYGVFANEGVKNPTSAILMVKDSLGNTTEEFTSASERALPENTARLISDILKDNQARTPAFGTDSLLHFPNHEVAVKTGTSNDYRDAWIVGYTPKIVVGAWVGNNDNSPMEKKVAGFIVAPMWHALMAEIIKQSPNQPFSPPPPSTTNLKPILRGVWRGGETYVIDKISQKLATEYTPENLKEERVIQAVHSILYWVDKNNPFGPAPIRPATDPQFNLWEEPVRRWALQNGLPDQNHNSLPTEYDDIHRPEFIPKFTILSPDNQSTYQPQNQITVKIQYQQTKFPMGQVDVFLNNNYVGSANKSPFEVSFRLADFKDSLGANNQLKVVVYDSVFNQTIQTSNIQLEQ